MTSRIPSYTEVYTTSPTAAGLPVLEVVRRLEEEKLISKDDRMALKDGLYSSDVVRREEIVKALCEVELSMNSRFSLRRLKAVIHQNGGGEVSSKSQHQAHPHTNYVNNPPNNPVLGQQPKSDPRPSKYRIKQNAKNPAAPEDNSSPNRERIDSGFSTATSVSQGNVSNVSNNSSAGLRLFPSPTAQAAQTPLVHSARDKSSGPIFTGFNSDGVRSSSQPTIHYTNNNIPMGSPVTSRSRGDEHSSSGVHYGNNNNISPNRQHSSNTSGANNNAPPSSGSYVVSTANVSAHNASTNATTNANAPNTGRAQRSSPYRIHDANGSGSIHTTTAGGNSYIINNNPTTAGYSNNNTHGGHNNNHNNNNNASVQNNGEEGEFENISTINAINQVVGNQPLYSGPDCFNNVLIKVETRLKEFYAKYDMSRGKRRFAILVGGGSFNPLTRMHLRTYFLAKQCLEAKYGYVVLGSLLSPAHGATVRERYRTNPSEIIPSPHRLAVAQLLVQNSKLLSVDPWEITRRRAMDYLSLLEHTQAIVGEQFPDVEIKVLFVCKPNMVPKLSPVALKDANFGVVTVCRTHESDTLRNALTSKWNGVITVVEDTAILDASLDIVTSRKVRDKMKLGHTVEQLVGEKINDYVQIHRLGQKMNGTEKWEMQEKILPNIASRPAGPTLSSQFNKSVLSAALAQQSIHSGTGLQMGNSTSNSHGLMLYYSGMVRSKNVLATVMQIFSITCLITCLWLFFGYSLAFAPALPPPVGQDSSPVYGDVSRFWLQGMRMDSYHQLAPTIPESVFCAYQLTFASITPALICGSFADRMKYTPMLIFMTLWHLIVYCPIAHSVWHPEGFLHKAGALDYAGFNVVHIASGMSGLVSSIMLGHRKGFGTEVFHPHNILLTAVGSSMLWVGWYGFNAGSAVGANENAGYALLMTQISTATAAMTWLFSEWYMRKQPSVLGMVFGAIAGLVAITPASGFVDPTGAFFIGLIAGPACYFGSQLKHYLGYDDALDGFGVHAIGGALGGILTGFFATDTIAPGINGVFYASTEVGGTQLGNQIYAIVVCAGWASFGTFIILKGLDMTLGLRVSEETEDKGLDHTIYRESIFDVEYGRRAVPTRSPSPVSEPESVVEMAATATAVAVSLPLLPPSRCNEGPYFRFLHPLVHISGCLRRTSGVCTDKFLNIFEAVNLISLRGSDEECIETSMLVWY